MTPEARDELRRIGAELDGHRQVRVKVGGVVLPEPTPVADQKAIEHEQHEQWEPRPGQQREPRSRRQWEPRPGQQRRQRKPRPGQQRQRPRSSGSAAHIRGVELRSHYEAQVVELAKAYPSAAVVAADDQGMWLRVDSAVLDGIDRTATFLVILPFHKDKFPKAWGFWNKTGGLEWIGKRHTNFPDGDVCAFVPESRAWLPGGDLAALFDLYTVWALRQLHLEVFGRWPGRQFSAHPFYSLIEFKPDEFCSCDRNEPPLAYGDCCRPEHLAMDLMHLKTGFERKMGFPLSSRRPPHLVSGYLNGGSDLPMPAAIVGSIKPQPELTGG